MFDNAADPVDAKIAAMTPEAITDWLVTFHGLPSTSRDTVARNLREQFKFHRLQGRVDQRPALAVLMEIFQLRQDVKELNRPKEPAL